ncbi:MAG: hypothetical protein HZB52_06665 [Chloroflexi bacterium]|nr:hypothetical protein [Chloroflexota bacterium]
MQFLHQLPLAKEKRIVFVLITSSLLGLIAGLLQPTLQVAVEQGQVLGGIVQYPTDNPFFIYQSKTWTFLAQFSAISLRLGLSEITLSLFFSGLAGVLSFSGFALWLFALADDILFALLAPPVFIKVLDIIVWSFNYPTNVLGIIHTYGMIGMTFIFFTSGLFAVGYRRWAWLFAGLSPAIHPSLGLWFNIILWVSVLSDFKNLRASFVEAVKFSSLGYILSAISLGYHLGSYQSPSLDAATAQRYMQAYLTFWDNHRMAIGFWRIDVSIIIAGMFVSVIWLLFKKIDLPHNAEFILRLYTATVIVGGIVVAILYSPLPFTLPDVLFVLMPTRFLNFAIVGYLPLTFGLFWRYRKQAWASAAMTLMIVCLALTVFFYSPSLWYMLLVQLAAWSLILLVLTRNERHRSENWSIFPLDVSSTQQNQKIIIGPNCSPMVQLITRRPVLNYMPINMLPYAIEGAPSMEKILRDIYSMDFFSPPTPTEHIQSVWEKRSTEEWVTLARQYDASEVLMPSSWTIQLARVGNDNTCTLYRIPLQ